MAFTTLADPMNTVSKTLLIASLAVVTVLPQFGCESTGVDLQSLSIETKAALDVLPADARFVGMADLAALGDNPNLSVTAVMGSLDHLEGEAQARLDDFLEATGFDPATDLTSVHVAVGGHSQAALVAHATFDPVRIVEFIDSHAVEAKKGSYRDMVTYEIGHGDETGAIGLSGGSIIVAGPSITSVHELLDRIEDGTPGLSTNAEVMDLIRKVSGSDSWFVASELPSETPEGDSELTQALTSVDRVSVGVISTPDEVRATTYLAPKEGVSARDLSDLVKGGVAVLKLGADDDPVAFGVLDDIRVGQEDGFVTVDVRVDNAAFAQIVR